MKIFSLKTPLSANQALTFTLGLSLLPGCGTEIGNGKKGTDKTASSYETPVASSTNTAAPAGKDTSSSGTTESAPSPSSKGTLLDYLLRACGSPVVDMKAATFRNSSTSATLTSSLPAVGSWRLIVDNPSIDVTLQRDSSDPSNLYAIKSSSLSLGTETCVSATAQTTAGITVKTISYSDGYKTSWTLDADLKITAIQILNPVGIVILRFDAQ